MLKIFVYFGLMYFMWGLSMSLSMEFFYLDFSFMFEWNVFLINSMNFEILIMLDWVSLLYISFIFFISSLIMMYSYVYMESEKFIKRFVYLVMLFILSMILMIVSPNVVSILIGWDGLGLVSYCLVIFYQNYSSFNSGMVTVLCNRIGDVGLLMAISLMMMSGSWNMWMLSGSEWISVLMLGLAGITKSAQIPFSVWLPMAMAAPTPVSALVHSSTLVTAGVYLLIRFNKVFLDSGISILLIYLSSLTMFMSGVMACVEYDLKKIIALSTLSQLGLMMMTLSLGLSMMAFYHLLTHAIFKSLLFMCAGIIIHSMMNSQDIRLFGNLQNVIPFTMMSFFIANLALCGFPFMAGFYSKDLIMELVYDLGKMNIFFLFLGIISIMFTVMYSIRLTYYMYFSNFKFYSYHNFSENFLMNSSMILLVIMSIMVGSLLNWMFFFDLYLVFLSDYFKLLTLIMCVVGVSVGGVMVMSNFFKDFYVMKYFFSSMGFLWYLYMFIYSPVNFWGKDFFKIDNSWVELFGSGLKSLIFKDFSVFLLKIFMLVFVFMYLVLVFLLVF